MYIFLWEFLLHLFLDFSFMNFSRPLYFINNFVSNKITSCYCCFLSCSFWSSFNCICSKLFSMINMFLTKFTAYVFTYTFTNTFTYIFSKRKKYDNLLQIFGLLVELNSVSFFMFYTLINNQVYICLISCGLKFWSV